MILYQFNFNFDPNNLVTSVFALGGPIFNFLAIVIQIILALAVVGGLFYYLYFKRRNYPVSVDMYEVTADGLAFSHTDRGGFIAYQSGGQFFKLMPGIMPGKWRRPLLVQPRLHEFNTSMRGGRYINYLRVSRDVFIPFKIGVNNKMEGLVEHAKTLDLASIEAQLTANYLKFRTESFWSKYGNQAILIAMAIIVGFFMFLFAKELHAGIITQGELTAGLLEQARNICAQELV